jgi:hypothetical protein
VEGLLIPSLRYDEYPGENPGYIFRGELDYARPLQSSLERYVLGGAALSNDDERRRLREEELKLIERFMSGEGSQIAAIADENINRVQAHKTDTFRWLSLMQHYGRPTRLIDFTLDIHVALFFATWHHARIQSSKCELASDDLVVYGFPCFGFDDFIQNKTPIERQESGKINMSTALARRIGLHWAKTLEYPEIRPSPLRTVGWDRPFFSNVRLRKQKGMFVYPYDEPAASLRDSLDSWLVGNLCADRTNDPFKLSGSGRQLPGITIKLPASAAAGVAMALANRHSLSEQTLMPEIEVAERVGRTKPK